MLIQLRSCSLIQLKCSLWGYNWGSAQPTYTKLYPHRLHFNCIKEHVYYTWIQWNCSNHLWGDSWVTGGVCLYGKPGCVYVILIQRSRWYVKWCCIFCGYSFDSGVCKPVTNLGHEAATGALGPHVFHNLHLNIKTHKHNGAFSPNQIKILGNIFEGIDRRRNTWTCVSKSASEHQHTVRLTRNG